MILPFMVSPILPAQAGEGKHKLVAATSENSAFVSVVSEPGMANTQAEDTLSLCFQLKAALVFGGTNSFRTFVKMLALVFSLASTIRPLVSPETDFPPIPSVGVARTSGISAPNHSAEL